MDSTYFLTILSIIVLIIYVYIKRRYTYWQRKGVEYIKPNLFYGNIKGIANRELAIGEAFKEFYKEFKSRGAKHGGVYMFFIPVYMPLDPEIIKCILLKDFDHFRNHGMYVNEESDPLTGNLFNLEDAKWKYLRAKLTPTFTSGKMKMMFNTLAACSSGLEDLLNKYAIIQDPVDIKDVLSCFTTDVIASCAFGLESNSLTNPNNEFRKYGKKIFETTFFSKIKLALALLVPKYILANVGFKVVKKDVEAFFTKIVKDTVSYREESKVYRKDFLQLLIQLKNGTDMKQDETLKMSKEKGERNLTMNELTAQCLVFFIAGFETSATTMSFALYELATNPDIQEKLREEIMYVLARHGNELTYECVMEMTYLDKVIQETLRKHPPATGIPRVCNTLYPVPGTNIVIEPGIKVHIPVIGIHHDPEYYPDPTKFDPERFNEENKAKRPACTYLPFGEGPRICIGVRFGLLQSKMGLISIIRHFRVTLNEKTVTPLKMDNSTPVLGVKGGIWLNIFKIDK